jgi:hypothetical protein
MSTNSTSGNIAILESINALTPNQLHIPTINDPIRTAYPELNDLRDQLQHTETVSEEMMTAIGNTINTTCNEIVQDMSRNNIANVERAFQLGEVVLECQKKLTVGSGKHRSMKGYFDLIDRIIGEYATAALVNEVGTPTYGKRHDDLKESRRRQITKYKNMAQCGERIMKYAYAGIEGSLEVRYLIRDMLLLDEAKAKSGKKRVKITPEVALKKISEIENRFPFPPLEAVVGDNVRDVFRWHTDMVATIYQCEAAGFDGEDIDQMTAKSYAKETGWALEKDEAEAMFASVTAAEVPKEERRSTLSHLLLTHITTKKELLAAAEEGPQRIETHLARICVWEKHNPFSDEVINKIKTLNLGSNIEKALEIIGRLRQLINTDATADISSNPTEGT